MTEAKIGVRLLQAQDGQGPRATTRSEEESKEDSSQGLRRSTALLTPGFQTSGLQSSERIKFCCWEPPPWDPLLSEPWDTSTFSSLASQLLFPTFNCSPNLQEACIHLNVKKKKSRTFLILLLISNELFKPLDLLSTTQ